MCLSNLEEKTFCHSLKGRPVARCPELCNVIVEYLDNTSNFRREINTLGSPKKALSAVLLRSRIELRSALLRLPRTLYRAPNSLKKRNYVQKYHAQLRNKNLLFYLQGLIQTFREVILKKYFIIFPAKSTFIHAKTLY